MKKCVSILGQYIVLRLAMHEDLHFLFELRQQANRDNTVHNILNFSSHQDWFDKYVTHDDDYLFVAEKLPDHIPQGTIALMHVDFEKRSAEIGRWLMLPGSKCGAEAILLAYRIAFEQLNIDTIFARVMKRNKGVARFHQYSGLQALGALAPETVDGKMEEMLGFSMSGAIWPTVQKKLMAMVSTLY